MFKKIGLAVAGLSSVAAILSAPASADATDDFPIPNRMLKTTCTTEQIMAAVRDVRPVYYERYMADYNNHSPQIQQAVRDKFHWFYSMDFAGRRAYSEELVTHFADPLTASWRNQTKLFWNNKGVAAAATDVCANYPPDDMSVWNWH